MDKFQNLGLKIDDDNEVSNKKQNDDISIIGSSRKSDGGSSHGNDDDNNSDFSSLGSVGLSSAASSNNNNNNNNNNGSGSSVSGSDKEDENENESLSSAGGLVRRRKRRNAFDHGGGGINDFARKIHRTHSNDEDEEGGYEDLSQEEINVMKLDVIYKLQVLNNAGYPSPREFSVADNYTTLEMELKRLQTLETMSYGLQLMRWGLVNGVSMIEACNENFRLTPLRLKGWSTSIHRKSHQLDPVLMELYQQWAYRVNIGPFSKLLAALLFSAVNCHMSNMIRDGSQKEGGDDMFSNLMGNFSKMMGRNNTNNNNNNPSANNNNNNNNDAFIPTPAPGSENNNKDQQQQQQPTMRGPSMNFNKT